MQIASMFHVHPLVDKHVLETTIKNSKSPCIMHIATHGFFLPNQISDRMNHNIKFRTIIDGRDNTMNMLSLQKLEDPLLRSGLALAGANNFVHPELLPKDAEDGILTAEDVSVMDLSDTELVVLSACDTALGDVQTGEGVFGLRRAFVLAGAQTLVMSLWKVLDEQTKELMVDFYKRLLSGKGRAEALREAQLSMKEKYPDPYYWGAFICQGNPGLLSSELLESVKEKQTH
jgi:CHAT domain-containing protein